MCKTPTLDDVMCKIAAWPDRREARLDQNEAPVYCGMEKGCMAQLRYNGNGPAYYKPSPRTVLYKVGDLDDWINASRRTSTAPDNEELCKRKERIAAYRKARP